MSALLHGDLVGADEQGEHDERDELAGVGLGGGHAYLGAGVDVDAAARLPADGAAHRVGHPHTQRPPLLAVAQRIQGVRRLPCTQTTTTTYYYTHDMKPHNRTP